MRRRGKKEGGKRFRDWNFHTVFGGWILFDYHRVPPVCAVLCACVLVRVLVTVVVVCQCCLANNSAWGQVIQTPKTKAKLVRCRASPWLAFLL